MNLSVLFFVFSLLVTIISGCGSGANATGMCAPKTTCSCNLLGYLDIYKATVMEVDDEILQLEVDKAIRTHRPKQLAAGDVVESEWSGMSVCIRAPISLNVGDTVVLFANLEEPDWSVSSIGVALWDDGSINLGTNVVTVEVPTEDLNTIWDDPKCGQRLDLSSIPKIPCEDISDESSGDDEPDDSYP